MIPAARGRSVAHTSDRGNVGVRPSRGRETGRSSDPARIVLGIRSSSYAPSRSIFISKLPSAWPRLCAGSPRSSPGSRDWIRQKNGRTIWRFGDGRRFVFTRSLERLLRGLKLGIAPILSPARLSDVVAQVLERGAQLLNGSPALSDLFAEQKLHARQACLGLSHPAIGLD